MILPDKPAARNYSTYLTLMGRMGESTGYPAAGVAVSVAAQVDKQSARDLLVIGTTQSRPLFTQWRAERMPVSLGSNEKALLTDRYCLDRSRLVERRGWHAQPSAGSTDVDQQAPAHRTPRSSKRLLAWSRQLASAARRRSRSPATRRKACWR
ncbi:cellulose biosynthesis cyclic di-GMP-binding regulatory protein BcsB [Cupriavidus basilensis]